MDYLENAKKIDWHFFNQRKRSPFFNWISIDSLVTKKIPLTDLDSNAKSWLTIDGWGACPEEEFQQIRRRLAEAIERDPNFLLKIIDAYKEGHDKALRIWQEIQSQNWENKSKTELAEALNRYIISRQPIDPWLNLPLLAEADLEAKLKSDLSKIFPDDPGSFAALTSPIYPSTQAEELKERAMIKTQDDLKKHWQKYRWISDTLMKLDYLPIEHFSKKEAVESDSREDFNNYYGKIEDESVRTLVDTIQKSIWFRSFRIESFYYSSYLILNLIEAISKSIRTTTKDLVYLDPPEIIDILKDSEKINLAEIKNRKYGFIQYWQPGIFETYSGHKIDRWIEIIKPGYSAESQKDISGHSAFDGSVSGKVVVIRNLEELPILLNEEHKGAILVTHGTNPQYTPYLKNISAIVTDEGGILCHAAIISREMKIPCIIGTKNATKILKNGDTIKVDANKGIVKIIEE